MAITGTDQHDTLTRTAVADTLLAAMGLEGWADSDGPGAGLWRGGATPPVPRIENVAVIRNLPCFTSGTLIETKRGQVAVEKLRPGARVLTRDNGYRPIRWIGRRRLGAGDLAAAPQLQPVRIAAGALGEGLPETDMLVSPQHRMLISGARAELLFGEAEVLVAARTLVDGEMVSRHPGGMVDYVRLVFDCAHMVFAEGMAVECFRPGPRPIPGEAQPEAGAPRMLRLQESQMMRKLVI